MQPAEAWCRARDPECVGSKTRGRDHVRAREGKKRRASKSGGTLESAELHMKRTSTAGRTKLEVTAVRVQEKIGKQDRTMDWQCAHASIMAGKPREAGECVDARAD